MLINWNRFTYKVNVDFFKKWSSQMAYILGFTFADGNVYKTTLAWDLKGDEELLEKINFAMGSNYPICRRRNSCRLKISNPVVVNDLKNLGVFPNKSKNSELPKVPSPFFPHFARGFFDGDGWVCIRKNKNEISVGFSNGSEKFLSQFIYRLIRFLGITTNNLRTRKKITKNGVRAITYQADYYWGNAYKILTYIYSNLKENDLFMERKYSLYQEAESLYEWVKSGGRKWREIERNFKKPMNEILSDFWLKGYNGPQIANKLEVHSSSIYRWLIRTEIRPAFSEFRRRGFIDG